LKLARPAKNTLIQNTRSSRFDLLPTRERDHLDLDASLEVRELPDNSYYQYNLMHYIREREFVDDYQEPAIHFAAFVPPTTLRELIENVRSGVVPETITIGLSGPPSSPPTQKRKQR
jgi:hypothetical protein